MQNLKLQVLWLDDSLGLAINQKTDRGIVPITSYYFWPASEAWEQIRFELDSKPWIPEEERLIFLNLVVEVMNRWQQSRTFLNEDRKQFEKELTLSNVTVIGIS